MNLIAASYRHIIGRLEIWCSTRDEGIKWPKWGWSLRWIANVKLGTGNTATVGTPGEHIRSRMFALPRLTTANLNEGRGPTDVHARSVGRSVGKHERVKCRQSVKPSTFAGTATLLVARSFLQRPKRLTTTSMEPIYCRYMSRISSFFSAPGDLVGKCGWAGGMVVRGQNRWQEKWERKWTWNIS